MKILHVGKWYPWSGVETVQIDIVNGVVTLGIIETCNGFRL